jgi:hypothetical protein
MTIDTYTHNTGEYRWVIKLAIGQTWVPHARMPTSHAPARLMQWQVPQTGQ